MKPNKNPMSLENLPEYLKSIRDSGNTESSCVVDMGTIVETKKFGYTKSLFAIAICLTLGISSILTYDYMSTKQITFVVDMNNEVNPLTIIPEMMTDSGGDIIAMEEKENHVYEVKVSTRKSKRSFLEWLHKNKNVKKAEIK